MLLYMKITLIFLGLVILVLSVILIKFYLQLKTTWCRSDTCLVGKTAIITGANSGIGYVVALDFAKRGCRVILACRDAKKAEICKENIIRETGNTSIIVRHLDLASFQSVRKFANEINVNESRLDILVNNAGLGPEFGEERTGDGLLTLMQTNHFSHFLLTLLLLDLLKKSAPSRVVNVSSSTATFAKLNVDKLNEFPGKHVQYVNSKLCNILFTIELAKKMEGTGVTSYSVHPGVVRSNILRDAKGLLKWCNQLGQKLCYKSFVEGAQTVIYASITKNLEHYNGQHFKECRKVARYRNARDPVLASELWKKSQEIVNQYNNV